MKPIRISSLRLIPFSFLLVILAGTILLRIEELMPAAAAGRSKQKSCEKAPD